MTKKLNSHIRSIWVLGSNSEIARSLCIQLAKEGCKKFHLISRNEYENNYFKNLLSKNYDVNVTTEIIDLANMLNSMGADIKGAGTDEIIVQGVDELNGTVFTIPADRIEAGTYLVAAAVTNGNITIDKIDPNRLMKVISKIENTGSKISYNKDSISISMDKDRPEPVDITTAPFPEFPTDMQAQFSVINAISSGVSNIYETVFENRFMHILELNRMGCNIEVKGNHALINGVESIYGAQVMATDLRASASLILAGLCAKGETVVDRIYHIDRGYERIEEKLNYLGANIIRLPS